MDQYDLIPTVGMQPGDTFGRPLQSGRYELWIHRQGRDSTSSDEPTCMRHFRIRTRTLLNLRVRYDKDGGCKVG